MRRLYLIVPLATAVAITSYLFARPAIAPADPTHPTAAQAESPEAALSAHGASPFTANELPITQVILYSSGVGYFQREGHVEGNTRVDLAFPVGDINDLLKSMVLQDLGGGHISAVAYDSHDPLDKTLNSFAIQLADNPSHAQVLNQARGEKVEIMVAGKFCGVSDSQSLSSGLVVALQGTVLGVEVKPVSTKDAAAVELLNLWCVDGMRSVPLSEVQRVKFLNPAIENEVSRALEVLARGHDTQKKAVSLQFNGSGKRLVSVGYVVEAPLWRTSYRLLIGKDGKLFVQGWAMVVNPTNEDWKDVHMALVSGRPISFKMDLYQPLYVPRPVVQPELYTSIRPTIHEGSLEKAPPTSGVAGLPFGMTPAPPTAQLAVRQPTGNPNAANEGFAKPPYGGYPGPEINLQQGIAAAAMATDLGNSYQYAIEHAVTIPRQKSALLPIVNQALEGDKVSLYSPVVHAKYPLLALRLKNSAGMHLMQGPVAVFEGSGYSGDAQLPDLQPGEERLISYALDVGTELETATDPSTQKLLAIRLQKGTLWSTAKVRESKTYNAKNRSPHDRIVLVEHPYRSNYTLVSKTPPKERASDVYRFEVKVAAGKTAKLEVAEELKTEAAWGLSNMNTATIKNYLQYEFSNPKVKTALERALTFQSDAAKTQQDRANLEKQLADITQDQARLRANLKEMPETAAAYKRYLEKFDNQETTIEKLQTQIQDLRSQELKQRQECAEYLEGLDLESTIKNAP
jgi:hypothetical protein